MTLLNLSRGKLAAAIVANPTVVVEAIGQWVSEAQALNDFDDRWSLVESLDLLEKSLGLAAEQCSWVAELVGESTGCLCGIGLLRDNLDAGCFARVAPGNYDPFSDLKPPTPSPETVISSVVFAMTHYAQDIEGRIEFRDEKPFKASEWTPWESRGDAYNRWKPKSKQWCRGELSKWIENGNAEADPEKPKGDVRFRIAFLKEMGADFST